MDAKSGAVLWDSLPRRGRLASKRGKDGQGDRETGRILRQVLSMYYYRICTLLKYDKALSVSV